MANLAVSSKYYNEAITTFNDIDKTLQTLTETTYISSIEQLGPIRVTRDTRVMFDDEVEKFNKYDCIPLQLIQSDIIIQKSLALSCKGNTKKGLELLEKLEESKIINQNETELHAAIANLRLLMLRQEISTRSDAKVLLHQSIALPEMNVKSLEGTVVDTKNQFRSIRDDFTNSVERMLYAYRTGYVRERPVIIEGLCKQSAFAMFLQNQMSKSSNVFLNNYALNSSYYLGKYKYFMKKINIDTFIRNGQGINLTSRYAKLSQD